MKFFILTCFLFSSIAIANEDKFESEAADLAKTLKTSLVKELTDKVAKDGAVNAIPFCHENVKTIAKTAAKNYLPKYAFGRTSHKIRNTDNKAEAWMNDYLEKFKATKADPLKTQSAIHKLPNGKRVYLEALYVGPQCLTCHGDAVTKEINDKIKSIYPADQATGFKLGEFRGFVWIKEK